MDKWKVIIFEKYGDATCSEAIQQIRKENWPSCKSIVKIGAKSHDSISLSLFQQTVSKNGAAADKIWMKRPGHLLWNVLCRADGLHSLHRSLINGI